MDQNSAGGSSDGGGEVGSSAPPGFASDGQQERLINPPGKTSHKTVVVVTYDKEVVRHEISDETLERLKDGDHSFFFDAFLASLFAAVASAPAGIDRCVTLVTKGPAPNLVDLLILVTPIVSAILTGVFLLLWRREGGSIRQLVANVRDRERKPGK